MTKSRRKLHCSKAAQVACPCPNQACEESDIVNWLGNLAMRDASLHDDDGDPCAAMTHRHNALCQSFCLAHRRPYLGSIMKDWIRIHKPPFRFELDGFRLIYIGKICGLRRQTCEGTSLETLPVLSRVASLAHIQHKLSDKNLPAEHPRQRLACLHGCSSLGISNFIIDHGNCITSGSDQMNRHCDEVSGGFLSLRCRNKICLDLCTHTILVNGRKQICKCKMSASGYTSSDQREFRTSCMRNTSRVP
eukprot:5785064-Amphidinium_carterae.1